VRPATIVLVMVLFGLLSSAGAEEEWRSEVFKESTAGNDDADRDPISDAASIAKRCPSLQFNYRRGEDVFLAMKAPTSPGLMTRKYAAKSAIDARRHYRQGYLPLKCRMGLALYGPDGAVVRGLLSLR